MSYQAEYLAVAIKMAVILVVMIGCLWGISVYLKKMMKGSGGKKSGRHIRVLENCYVGVKKSISLVQVPGSVLVIGLSGDRITLLSKIDPGELNKSDDN
jgi:flagellar protein FliO/FliZ